MWWKFCQRRKSNFSFLVCLIQTEEFFFRNELSEECFIQVQQQGHGKMQRHLVDSAFCFGYAYTCLEKGVQGWIFCYMENCQIQVYQRSEVTPRILPKQSLFIQFQKCLFHCGFLQASVSFLFEFFIYFHPFHIIYLDRHFHILVKPFFFLHDRMTE